MRRALVLALLAYASTVYAVEIPVQRVADDAKVIDRVAQMAKRDLPQDLLKRILNEDIDALRGKRGDGTYDNATYERLESSRADQSFSVQPRKSDQPERFEIKGSFAYRLIIDLPSRRMLVTKNRRVYIDHVELEYIPLITSATRTETVKVEAWMEPGETRAIEFPEVARQATARVYAKADEKAGYGNIVLTLIKAKVLDNADSPYADAVASAKAMLRAVDNNDIPSIRAMATRMRDGLAAKLSAPATRTVEVVAPPVAASTAAEATTTPATTVAPATLSPDVYSELESIEDLLTGNEGERRQGLDRLHQLVRRLRPR
ncbi:MAG: hypothetical protein ACXW19_05290 [Thermoanaerobaculia bacterium]